MNALAQDYELGGADSAPLLCDIGESYNQYYSTGLYERRYPRPNQQVLRLILDELGPEGGRILDFGCGSGRYALPLARQPGVSVFAYDISAAAIQDLSRRCNAPARGAPPPLELLSGSLDDLAQRLDGDRGFDLVLLLFGVLGHIQHRRRRLHLLRSLRARLRPGGRLIVSVPNRARRFPAEQRAADAAAGAGLLEPGDIRYQRRSVGGAINLFYHLYSPAEFRAELREAGFAVARLRAESVLTERAIVSSPVCAAADAILRRVVPVSLAYGFLAVAQPAASTL